MEWRELNSCGSGLGRSDRDSKTSGSTNCVEFFG